MPGTTDFFVSYNHHDQSWAEWIAWQLEDAGYSALIQAWDFRPGSNFLVEMQNGLSSANRMILVLSKYFLKSDFTAPEWATMFANDPRGIKRKVVSVRVSDCQPTGLLTSLVYVDLVGKEEAAARQELLAGVREGLAKPSHAPRFPRNEAPAFPRSAIEQPADERAKFTLVLTGTIDALDKPLVEAILEHLKKVSSDASMTLIRSEEGSIRLVLEGSQAGLERLKDLFQSGQLIELAGLPIEAMIEEMPAADGSTTESQITPSVEAMFERRYREFVGVAKHLLKRVTGQTTLDETALISEAFIRLQRPQGGSLSGFSPGGLTAVIARTMRNILIDSSLVAEHRSGQLRVTFEEPLTDSDQPITLLMIDEALAKLAKTDQRAAEIIELYYFGDYRSMEIAKLLGLPPTVVSDRRLRALKRLKDILAPSKEGA